MHLQQQLSVAATLANFSRVCLRVLPPCPVNFTEKVHLGAVTGGRGRQCATAIKRRQAPTLVPAVTSPTEDEQTEEPSQTVTAQLVD